MKDNLKKIRAEVYSGKYKLKSSYKYKYYYNMLYEYLLKDYILNNIKSGGCRLWTDYSRTKESELLERLKKDLLKYILADSEYTDEELSKEL